MLMHNVSVYSCRYREGHLVDSGGDPVWLGFFLPSPNFFCWVFRWALCGLAFSWDHPTFFVGFCGEPRWTTDTGPRPQLFLLGISGGLYTNRVGFGGEAELGWPPTGIGSRELAQLAGLTFWNISSGRPYGGARP